MSSSSSAAASSSGVQPERIKNYRLGITLGIGSFGKVKLGVHEPTGIQVAIKILNKKRVKSMDMAGKIWREINILKLFVHPHIIRLYEIIDTATDIYVVMEHVEGGELFEYIVAKGRLSEDEARRFFQQIVAGVEYCHRHMVVHRDLKPENLLLSKDLQVKIADFGLSKLYAGAEVDVWSIGVILYALLCGSLPFDDENVASLFKKIKGGIYTLPSHLSDLSRDLIPKLLVVDPLQRLTIAEIRQHPWFQQKLPPYLALPPDMRPPQQQEILESAVERVMTCLGVSHEQVIQALASSDMCHNAIAVTYNLIKDHHHPAHTPGISPAISIPPSVGGGGGEAGGLPSGAGAGRGGGGAGGGAGGAGGVGVAQGEKGDFPEFQSLSVSWHHDVIANSMGSATSMSMGSSVPNSAVSHSAPHAAHGVSGMGSGGWFVGIPTRIPPREGMMELLRVLKREGYMWKFVSPYKLKCMKELPQHAHMKTNNAPAASPPVIKIGINMYRRRDGQGYIVDIWNMDGGTQTFLEMAHRIVTELKL